MAIKSKWQGLWNNRQGVYSGKLIAKKDIPTGKGEKVRLIVRHNKYYEKDSNRPRFVYCFADSEAHEDFCEPVEWEEYHSRPYKDDDGCYYDEEGNRLYTREDARAIINGTVADVKYGITDPYDILPEDFA